MQELVVAQESTVLAVVNAGLVLRDDVVSVRKACTFVILEPAFQQKCVLVNHFLDRPQDKRYVRVVATRYDQLGKQIWYGSVSRWPALLFLPQKRNS